MTNSCFCPSQSMTSMTTLLLRRRRSSVPSPRSRCLATLNSSGNLANLTSFTNLSFIGASKQYVASHLLTKEEPINQWKKWSVWLCCSLQLLEKKKRVQLKDMGEDLECLCQIMRTVGPRLDHEKAKVRAPSSDYCAWSCRGVRRWDGAVAAERNALSSLSSALYLDANCCIVRSPHFCPSLPQSLMDQYFGRMRSLMNNKELPARIRFLLQDTVELRENNWVPRKAFIDNGPKTINQIRQDAVKVSFVCPAQQKLGSHTTAAVWPLRVFFFCRIWVFSSQRPCLRGWGTTSSWKAPSCPTEWNLTGRRSVVWRTCLDRCQVCEGVWHRSRFGRKSLYSLVYLI